MNKKILIITLITIGLAFFFMFFNAPSITEINQPDDKQEKNSKQEPKEPRDPEEQLPKIAIIIDDLGNSFSQDKKIASIKADLTLAILPFRENTQKSLNFFQEKQEIILHLPLEPVSEKEKEKNMITTDMKEQEISNKFNLALADLNYQISGVNNHKGSLFTSDKESMKTLLKQIKEKSLFFVDSYTIASSEAYNLAKQMNIKTIKRDVFLDGSKKEEDIKVRLQETVNLAEEKGFAVAIGHSRPATINVLLEEIPKLKNKIEFVKVSEILE